MKLAPKKGYVHIVRTWKKGDRVDLVIPMPVERIEAHPAVRQDAGFVALQCGPIVYCLEEADNGPNLADIALPRSSKLAVSFDKKLDGAAVITGRAVRRETKDWKDTLYRPVASKARPVTLKAVPYALWNNRGEGEMRVWIHET